MLLSLITTVIVTHVVSLQSYGDLALYLFIGSFVTVVCNMGSFQGTFALVFGISGDDSGDFDLDTPVLPGHRDPRRIFGIGFVLTLIVATTAAVLVWVLAGPISTLLPHRPDGPTLVRLAGLSGAMGALWRLQSNFLRYARRPAAFAVTQAARPGFALVITAILVISGDGIEGVLIGLAAGTFVALLLCLVLGRRDIRPAFSLRESREIMHHGKYLVPTIASYWTVQHADVYVLSLWAGPATVGIYKLASSLSRMASYLVSSFTMSWGPLLRSPLAIAAERERGRQDQGAATVGAYAVIGAFVVMAMGVFGDYLVKIAPHSFGKAANLIALLALVPIGRGWFVVTYQTSTIPNKRKWFVRWAVSSGCCSWRARRCSCPCSVPTARRSPASSPSTCPRPCSWRSASTATLLPLPWRQILGGTDRGGGAVAGLLRDRSDRRCPSRVGAVPLLAYPVLMVLIGAVPRAPFAPLLHPLDLWRHWRRRNDRLRARLAALSVSDRELVDELLRQGTPVAQVASARGERELTVLTRFGVIIRTLAGVSEGPIPTVNTASLPAVSRTVGDQAHDGHLARRGRSRPVGSRPP